MTYVPLDVRTEYSFRQALCRVPALVERARAFRFEALGVADVHSVLALPRFALAAREAGIRPLLGARVRLHAELPGSSTRGGHQPEILLYATDARGYGNLLQLVCMANLECAQGEAGVSLEDLDNGRAGLLALDGGLAGPLSHTLAASGPRAAQRLAGRLRELFGAGNFFVQVQRHGENAELALEPHLLHLARTLNVAVVAANETRYLDAEEARQYEALRHFGSGHHNGPSSRALRPRQHLRSPVEMEALFHDLPEALENTRLVAERCQFQLEPGWAPEFATASGRLPPDELRVQCERGACSRYNVLRYQDVPATARDRIHHELAKIAEKKLASCFLLAQGVVRQASEEGVPMGPGRGGLAGSLVAYVLGVSETDPLSHGLSIEPFLAGDPVPEFEFDVAHWAHGRLLQALRRSHGGQRVVRYGIVERLSARAAVRLAASALGADPSASVEIETMLSRSGAPAPDNSSRRPGAWQRAAQSRAILDLAIRLEGLALRLVPSHGGLMVGATSLAANVALQRNGDGLLLAQATSEDASVLGLVRLHLEPSRAVSLLDRTTKLAAAARRRLPSAGHPPLDDERTYRLLASGATLGVPGLEGSRAQSLLRRLQPARFNDLRTALALLHAAARGHETQGTSASLVNGWPELQAQLQDTHGFLLFEEQVLEIAANLAGFQQATAESLHAAVCQRDWRALGKLRPAFLSGAVERGAGVEQAEALFARLVAAQGLLVSRARMTALAIQAYRAAFLSAHAPEEFFTVLLDLSTGQSARADSILREAVERQVRLLDVDVQRSAARPQLERDAIRLGFVQVRHVGESLAGRIVANRSQQGPFTTLASFRRRLPEVPDRAVASLIAAGAFASLGVQRGARVESKRTGRRRRVSSSQQLELGFMSGASSRSKSVVGAEVRHGSSRHGISKLVARSTAADAAKAPSVQGHGEALGGGNAEPAPDAPAKLWILGRIRARA